MNRFFSKSRIVAWVGIFAIGYAILAVTFSLLLEGGLALFAWLPSCLVTALLGASPEALVAGGWTPPQPSSADQIARRRARLTALRWSLCLLLLANAAVEIHRAFTPERFVLKALGHEFHLVPLDLRFAETGFDLGAMAIGLGFAFIGLCELRLRLRGTPLDVKGARAN
jgi:hypothetical protein